MIKKNMLMIVKFLLILLISIMLITIIKKNNKEHFYSDTICNGFRCENDNCAITSETRRCDDDRILINGVPECYFNKVVDPNNLKCIDFCVKTYTWKDGTNDNMGNDISKQFIESKKHNYFASKCGECIDNNYDRIMLLGNRQQ